MAVQVLTKIDNCKTEEVVEGNPSCTECETAFGLYPNTDKDKNVFYTCLSCSDSKYVPSDVFNSKILVPCKNCTFESTSSLITAATYTCNSCDDGYYMTGVMDAPFDPKYWGTSCAKCPTMCATCNTRKQCLSCPDGRVKVEIRFFGDKETGPWWCYYNTQNKLLFAGSVLLVAIFFCLFTSKWGFSKVKDIERAFIT